MEQSVSDQIEEMLKVTDEPTITVPEEPETEPEPELPKEEENEEPEPEPKPEGDEKTGEEEEEVEEKLEETIEEEPKKPEEEPEEEPEETEVDRIKRENEELRKRIDDLSAPKEPKPEEPKEPEPKPEPKEPKLEVDEQDFIGDLDLDDLTRDPKEFNKLLNKVYTQGVETTRKVLGEGILRSIPDMVKNNVTTVISLRKASEDFYERNEDLKPFKKVVSAVFAEVASDNPDKKMEELLEDVETESRKRLELYKKAVNPKPETPNNPRLPRKKSQPRSTNKKPDVNPLINEIDQMNKTLSEV